MWYRYRSCSLRSATFKHIGLGILCYKRNIQKEEKAKEYKADPGKGGEASKTHNNNIK